MLILAPAINADACLSTQVVAHKVVVVGLLLQQGAQERYLFKGLLVRYASGDERLYPVYQLTGGGLFAKVIDLPQCVEGLQ